MFQENRFLFLQLENNQVIFSLILHKQLKTITVFFYLLHKTLFFLPVQTLNFFNIKFIFKGYFLLENFQH